MCHSPLVEPPLTNVAWEVHLNALQVFSKMAELLLGNLVPRAFPSLPGEGKALGTRLISKPSSRWWPCQIPHPGNMLHDQNPHPGDRPHSQSPPSLGLNIDKCIIGPDPEVSYINLFLIINFVNLTWIQ